MVSMHEAVEQIAQLITHTIVAILSVTFPFIVGDSTVAKTTEHAGYGSGFPGHGFSIGSAETVGNVPVLRDDIVNPLLLPDESYDGPVVLAVSLWDSFTDDLSSYQRALDHYTAAGYDVIVVEVPEINDDLAELNVNVSALLGCELVDQKFRDVELEDPVHPSDYGAVQLGYMLGFLGEESYCTYTTSN